LGKQGKKRRGVKGAGHTRERERERERDDARDGGWCTAWSKMRICFNWCLREGCSFTLLLSLSGNGRSQSTFSHKQSLSVIVAKGFAGTFQKRVVSQLVSISLSLSPANQFLMQTY
jgi:hypothetical protein